MRTFYFIFSVTSGDSGGRQSLAPLFWGSRVEKFGNPWIRQQWPEFFDIPNFSIDVEYRLRQADLAFMKDETRMTLPRDMKHDILEKLAETMYSFKAYRTDDDFSSVAKALISKHPCLTEPGPHRWYGWKNSLKFKMANFRTKLRKAGCEDVAINGGKRSKGICMLLICIVNQSRSK